MTGTVLLVLYGIGVLVTTVWLYTVIRENVFDDETTSRMALGFYRIVTAYFALIGGALWPLVAVGFAASWVLGGVKVPK